jgi:hypothetical protein
MSGLLETYLKERSQLIAEDTSLRCDTDKLRGMTPAESKAEEIVRKVRKQENEQVSTTRAHSHVGDGYISIPWFNIPVKFLFAHLCITATP